MDWKINDPGRGPSRCGGLDCRVGRNVRANRRSFHRAKPVRSRKAVPSVRTGPGENSVPPVADSLWDYTRAHCHEMGPDGTNRNRLYNARCFSRAAECIDIVWTTAMEQPSAAFRYSGHRAVLDAKESSLTFRQEFSDLPQPEQSKVCCLDARSQARAAGS